MSAAAFFVGVAVGIAFLAICNAWDRQQREVEQVATPLPSTRAVTSNRKSGRTVRHG